MLDEINTLKKKYERFIPAGFFLGGFIFDTFTIGRVDEILNLVQIVVFISAIYFFTFIEFSNKSLLVKDKKLFRWLDKERNEVFHFILGAALSMIFLFFFKSASIGNSFVFMAVMTSLLLLNETKLFKSLGVALKSASFSLCLYCFFLIFLPTLIGRSGLWIFLLSTLFTLGVVFVLYRFKRKRVDAKLTKSFLVPSVLVISFIVGLYFLKLIPPVPLSLKHIGVYRGLEKANQTYNLDYSAKWWQFWISDESDYLWSHGDKVYVFTQVFSPGGFKGKIFYRWQIKQNKWRTSDRLPVKITGGRGEGFRGYSYKQNIVPGNWRILVENEDGLELGRIYFDVNLGKPTGELKQITL